MADYSPGYGMAVTINCCSCAVPKAEQPEQEWTCPKCRKVWRTTLMWMVMLDLTHEAPAFPGEVDA